jgi:hypothetical protein
MNPIRSGEEVRLTTAIFQLGLGETPEAVAAMIERSHPGVPQGGGMAYVRMAQDAAAQGQAVGALLPGEEIGAAVPKPLGAKSVMVSAVVEYSTRGGARRYATIRYRARPDETADAINDALIARAEGDDTLPAASGAGEIAGITITHAW